MSRTRFWARTVRSLAEATAAVEDDRIAAGGGGLQRIDPRVKIVSFMVLASAAAVLNEIRPLLVLLLLGLALTVFSRIRLTFLMRRAWGPTMALALFLAVPMAFLTPGRTVAIAFPLAGGLTEEGLLRAGTIVLRVLTASTFCCVLLVTTQWSSLLKGLRLLGVPAVLVTVLSLSFRYVVHLLRTAQEMFEAAESRRVGLLRGADYRRHLGAQVGVLAGKTAEMSESVFLAMTSRGFRGDIRIFHEFAMTTRDWLALGAVVVVALALLTFG